MAIGLAVIRFDESDLETFFFPEIVLLYPALVNVPRILFTDRA